jgi:hypothetical protein
MFGWTEKNSNTNALAYFADTSLKAKKVFVNLLEKNLAARHCLFTFGFLQMPIMSRRSILTGQRA